MVAILKRIVAAVRDRWPDVTLDLRADSGFAIPALYAWCEAEHQAAAQDGAKVRLLGETTDQANSWPHPRRVVMKAEVLPKGTNTRFVVTTRTDAPTTVDDWYVDRGASENWIKDLKSGCFADRLSCHRFWANQFRLLRHAAAYWLLDTLRRWLEAVGVARMTLETLRLRLIKIGGWVRTRRDRARLRLASSHPSEAWWRALAARPTPS